MENKWIAVKNKKPPSLGKDFLFWVSKKDGTDIKLCYKNEYGTFELLTGNGIAYSFWQPLEAPEPPKE